MPSLVPVQIVSVTSGFLLLTLKETADGYYWPRRVGVELPPPATLAVDPFLRQLESLSNPVIKSIK